MEFDVQIAHGVEEIDQESWDHLSGSHPLASYRWYRFGETVLDDEPVYIVLSHQGEPMARATFWIRRWEWVPIAFRPVRRLLEAMIARWPLLTCRSPVLSTSGLILPDPPLRSAALKAITQVAMDQAQQHKASFVLFDYLGSHEVEQADWPSIFTATTISEPGTRLVITWPDFDSYIKHLGRNTRRSCRRNSERAADLGIEIKYHPLTQPLSKALLDQAMVLIHGFEKRYNYHDPWAKAILQYAHMVDATWIRAEIDGRLVGCVLILGDRDTRMVLLLGRDYSIPYTYFLLFYSAIRRAIEEGVHVLKGGNKSYELKQRLGFQIEDNDYIMLAGRGPLFQRIRQWV